MTSRVRSNTTRRGQLIRAAYDGDLETIKSLVAEGEDINLRSDQGARPLNIVVERDHENCAAWMLEHGAAVNTVSSDGQTPLTDALINKNARMVNLLLDHGANVDIFGKSEHPAAWAMRLKADDHVLNRILDSVNDVDVCDQVGKTLLFSAIECDRADCVTNLIRRGADLRRRNSTGGYAIHVAARTSPDMIEALLPYFPDLNIRDFSGRTPLHGIENPECIRALVAAGADIDARDTMGSTPLITAINTGYLAKMPTLAEKYRPAIVELMSLGADLSAQNHKEESARSLVKHYKIKYLNSVLAAIDARNSMAGVVDVAKARAAAKVT